jgi:ribosomal protein S18 acetylase RimI-like enzyme
MPSIQYAVTEEAFMACTEVIQYLRPLLRPEQILELLKQMQEEKYELIYVTAEEDPSRVAAFAGFRHRTMLVSGTTIYIDDLACLPEFQGRGYATLLLNHIRGIAEKEGLRSVRLDSGPDRLDAHKLYHRRGYYISAFHFTQPLAGK